MSSLFTGVIFFFETLVIPLIPATVNLLQPGSTRVTIEMLMNDEVQYSLEKLNLSWDSHPNYSDNAGGVGKKDFPPLATW